MRTEAERAAELMSNVLTSWKEIAQYLGKGVRTAQRWEAAYGLPVRRAHGGDHRSVFAIPAELDVWLQSQGTNPESELDALRREVAALREEVALLRQQRSYAPVPRAIAGDGAAHDDIWVRISEVLVETRQITQQTHEALNRARMLRESIFNQAAIQQEAWFQRTVLLQTETLQEQRLTQLPR